MVTEESTKETVKTIARGMPVDLAEPVVTAACFFCCRRAMGEAITRHSLRPLHSGGARLMHHSGNSCLENAQPCARLFERLNQDKELMPRVPFRATRTGRANARPMTGSA